MEKKKVKTLLFSMLALCMSVMLVVGGTYALFTGDVRVNNHLQAGNLTVGLYRTAYVTKTLNDEGYLEESEVQKQNDVIDAEDVNLKKDKKELFVVNQAVPQSYYAATIDVINEGSVAFEYGMRILVTAGKKTHLVKQIQITVTYGEAGEKTFLLSAYETNDVDLGVLTKGKAGRFTVKAEFINDNDVNNDAMDESVKFDVQVFATQKTAE